jgi:hypothetical protein
MKIQIGSDDEVMCTAEAIGDSEINWHGNSNGAKKLAKYYADIYGKSGEELLKFLVSRLKGRTWAVEVENTLQNNSKQG